MVPTVFCPPVEGDRWPRVEPLRATTLGELKSMLRSPNHERVVLWRGPSPVDGASIMLVATGILLAPPVPDSSVGSTNTKTGRMVQTWIVREDVRPRQALDVGQDSSVCGECPMRRTATEGGSVRGCYVRGDSLNSVFTAVSLGRYVECGPEILNALLLETGQQLRVGSYGDPAMVPFPVWSALAQGTKSVGYTHQWRVADTRFAGLLMASVETIGQRAEAIAAGWRTFRVRMEGTALDAGEFVCPASKEAGQKTTCARCLLCGGTESRVKKSPAIIAHGVGASRFPILAKHHGWDIG